MITIVIGESEKDHSVTVDGRSIAFDLSEFDIDSDVWAIHFDEDTGIGKVERSTGAESINSLGTLSSVLSRYNTLVAEEDALAEEIASAPPTDAEMDRQLKLGGIEFDGVMCSATSRDMWGLSAIKDWVRSGSQTNFEFENGNVLTITEDNIDEFEATWIPFRSSFFQ